MAGKKVKVTAARLRGVVINHTEIMMNPIQSNPMSITEAGQRPLFSSLSKNLKYKTQINSNRNYFTLPVSSG